MTDTPLQDLSPAAFQAHLRALATGPETLEETRARLDRRADTIPVPDGCAVAEETIGGVACERLTPKGAEAGRTLLYLHGGGYGVGSPRSHRYVASRLADLAGCETVVPDYALAPEQPFPAAVDDALTVYRALLHRPGRLVVGGDSAGAGLAAAAALSAREAGLPQPAGLLLLSPWVDLAHEGTTYAREANDTVTLSALRQAAKAYAGEVDLKDPLISPVYADLSGLPPMLIQVGTEEALLTDSLRLAERAALAGVDVRLHVLPHLVHSFMQHFAIMAGVRAALAEAGAWIRERTEPHT